MRYESLLASRYIKAQKRQSVFTCVSIAAAIAVMTMIFVLYSVCINCLKSTVYSSAPYHLVFSELTEEQGKAMADFAEIRSVKLQRTEDGVSAYILFGSDIGDRETWLKNAARQIGASQQYEKSKHSSLHGAYEWNDNLMQIDGIGYSAKLFRLRIFCIFFIFAILIAFALRLIIDTAFEVSSKERERHYGVLQSIGATPEQIVRIITLEGLRLCGIAIPFGLLAGIGFACLMYHVLLRAGISELFQSMTNAKLSLPFSVDPKMLLVASAVGAVWVFLSAYGVGMRIIRKTPMEAITTRANHVEKVRKHTLSGLLFGISGSIASRNARRQKKRFAVTVLTMTVSITLFALFSSLTETAERSINGFIQADFYDIGKEADFEFEMHSILATLRAGVLMLNLLLALAALINLLNIVSTGIANRRSELASLQCMGMTDLQLDRMAVIECLQFTGVAAAISTLICVLVIFGTESGLTALVRNSFADEREEVRKMLLNLVRIDHIMPFVRLGIASLAAFAAGCITSLVMLRVQNKESLTNQIRGPEMQHDLKESHLLRNSVLVTAGAFVLVIAGLRVYSIAAYHHDRNKYAKAGYLHLVDGADNKINVYSTGAQNGKHTIVGLAGMGVEYFPVVTKALNERLGKENKRKAHTENPSFLRSSSRSGI